MFFESVLQLAQLLCFRIVYTYSLLVYLKNQMMAESPVKQGILSVLFLLQSYLHERYTIVRIPRHFNGK